MKFIVALVTLLATAIYAQNRECPKDFFNYNGLCYQIVYDNVNWYEAQSRCSSLHSNLAPIKNVYSKLDVIDAMSGNGTSFWIIVENDPRYRSRFEKEHPAESTNSDTEYCTAYKDKLVYRPCTDSLPYICEIIICRLGYIYLNKRCMKLDLDYAPLDSYNPRMDFNNRIPTSASVTNEGHSELIKDICQVGWYYYPPNGKCYMVSSREMKWWKAKEDCQKNGGTLAKITNKGLSDSLKWLASDQTGHFNYWIGLHDIHYRRIFVWTSDNSVLEETDFSDWANNEPEYPYADETCVALDGKYQGNFKWNVMLCRQRERYICESICPAGWYYYQSSGTCYKMDTEKMIWYNAQEECEMVGASLVKISDPDTNDYIKGLASAKGVKQYYWIGAKDIQTQRIFYWISDNSLLSEDDFTDWGSSIRYYKPQTTTCVYLDGWIEYKWINYWCDSTMAGYFCEKNCPEGWTYYQPKRTCYKLSTKELNWENARDECESEAGSLAQSSNAGVNSFLKGLARTKSLDINYWIGLKASMSNDTFVWTRDNSQLSQTDFNDWADGKPNNTQGGESCVVLSHSNNFTWSDNSCNTPGGYICEKMCPVGWHFYKQNGKCYQLNLKELSWYGARDECDRKGGSLATIKDESLNYFIRALLEDQGKRVNYWIGLTDSQSEGIYRWTSDNSEADYTQFSNTTLSNAEKDCILFSPAGPKVDFWWSDEICNSEERSICEM